MMPEIRRTAACTSARLISDRPLIAGPKLIDFDDVRVDLMPFAREIIARQLDLTEESEAPRLIHMSGISGSGKSTYVINTFEGRTDLSIVGNDRIMLSLPQYLSDCEAFSLGQAFTNWEMPVRAIGYHLFQALIENKRNIVFDHTGTLPAHVELINKVKGLGYHVEMHYLGCPLDVALARAKEREVRIQRSISPERIKQGAETLQQLLPVYREITEFIEIDPACYGL